MNVSEQRSQIKDFNLFKQAISFVSKIVDEVNIKFSGKNIIFQTQDLGIICLFKLTLLECFQDSININFECNISDLNKIIEPISTNNVVISVTKYDIIFNYENETHTLNALDIEIEELSFDNLHKIKYDLEIVISKDILQNALNKTKPYNTDLLQFKYDTDGIQIEAVSSIGKYTYNHKLKEESEDRIVAISIDYIKAIIESFEGQMKLYLKNDHPIRIDYEKDGLTLEWYQCQKWYQAPRVEELDEEEF